MRVSVTIGSNLDQAGPVSKAFLRKRMAKITIASVNKHHLSSFQLGRVCVRERVAVFLYPPIVCRNRLCNGQSSSKGLLQRPERER